MNIKNNELYINDENEEEPNIYFHNSSHAIKLSDKTIDLATELSSASVIDTTDATAFLGKTSELTNSVIFDKSVSDFNYNPSSFISDPQVNLDETGRVFIDTQKNDVSQFIHSGLDSIKIADTGLTDFGTSALNDVGLISNTLQTGIANEGILNTINSEPLGITQQDSTAFTEDSSQLMIAHDKSVSPELVNEIFIKTKHDFVLDHRSDIQEKALIILEEGVHEQRRANDLKERELDMKEEEIVSQKELSTNFRKLEKTIKAELKNLLPSGKQSKGYPFKIKSGITWENVIITFKNKKDVEVIIQDQKHTTNFANMGFADGRTSDGYNLQWALLLLLAKSGGQITTKEEGVNNNYKKQKELLTKKLQKYFGIEYDPFKKYTTEEGYSIKLTLIPPEED